MIKEKEEHKDEVMFNSILIGMDFSIKMLEESVEEYAEGDLIKLLHKEIPNEN